LLSFSEKFSQPWLRGLFLGFLVFWLMTPLSFLPLGKFLENRALDFFYQWRPAQSMAPEILLVGIDEASFQELRRAWPWPRSWHARLVKRLSEAGAKLIVFDIIFAEPSTPEEDQDFIAAVQAAGNVVLAKTLEVIEGPRFRRQILITPMPHLAAASDGVGLAMVTPDPDGVVRRFKAKLAGQTTISALTARLYNPSLQIPDSLSGLIDYSGPSRSLDILSYYQVLDSDHPLPAARVRGKIVLVGRMLEASVDPRGQADAFYTPYFSLTGKAMSGVEIQGHIIHTLLQGRCGRTFPDGPRVFVFFFLFLGAGYLFARFRPLSGLIGLIILCLGLFVATFYLFLRQCLWFPPVLLASGLIMVYGSNSFFHYLLEAKDKRWLRQAFSRYVSNSLVEIITDHPDQLRLGGEEVDVSVLFSDIVGFTSVSEDLTPENLIHLLNEYFSTMTDIILNCKGTVDKYIGDAIMAFWGAPLPLADHSRKACQAALAMQEALPALKASWRERRLPPLEARLGIHTGRAIVGNVGSRDRFNYTVMGDTVNLASRLEGVNRIYGTTILVSESTFQQAGDGLLFREVDLVQVKGRLQPVTIYELLGRQEEKAQFPWIETFGAAILAYRQRQWDLATQLFRDVLVQRPNDPPSLCFQRRLKYFQQHPPLPDWRGIYTLDSK
jgi:adenylate cyclase